MHSCVQTGYAAAASAGRSVFWNTSAVCGSYETAVQSQGGILLMQGNQMPGKPLVLLFSGADAPVKPGVITAAGDFQKSA